MFTILFSSKAYMREATCFCQTEATKRISSMWYGWLRLPGMILLFQFSWCLKSSLSTNSNSVLLFVSSKGIRRDFFFSIHAWSIFIGWESFLWASHTKLTLPPLKGQFTREGYLFYYCGLCLGTIPLVGVPSGVVIWLKDSRLMNWPK